MKQKLKMAELKRDQLDERLGQVRKLGPLPQPKSWIRTMREALGMPLTTLAKRLKISPPSVTDYEHSEEHGKITVATLNKVANALECDLQILFVPKRPIAALLHEQALKSAARIVKRAALHMSLEDQKTSERFERQQIEKMAKELEAKLGRSLWEDS